MKVTGNIIDCFIDCSSHPIRGSKEYTPLIIVEAKKQYQADQLQQKKEDDISIPEEIFDYPDYYPVVTFQELVDQLPEELDDQQGQVPLIGVKIEIVRQNDKKTVTEIIVDRFDYEETNP